MSTHTKEVLSALIFIHVMAFCVGVAQADGKLIDELCGSQGVHCVK